MSKLRVAVIGGGIAGLTLAAALGRMDKAREVEVDIYEASPKFQEIGAGIAMFLRIWEILKNIGMEETVRELLPSDPDETSSLVFKIRKSDQRQGVEVIDMMMKGGGLRFHRVDFQSALLKHVPPTCRIHFSHRLRSYVENADCTNIEFENGAVATCDLLIGADGIKSVVRKIFLENLSEDSSRYSKSIYPIYSGTSAFRGLVPTHVLKSISPGHRVFSAPMMYCGKNKHLLAYPVSNGRIINVVAFFSDFSKEGTRVEGTTTTPVTVDEVLSTYAGWEDEVLDLLRCIENPTKWAIQTLIPLECWGKGRVLLLGDAAHAMTPHQGSGAGQAIEDAYVLAAMLSHPTCNRENIPRVVDIYNSVRRPFGNSILEGSRVQGMICELNSEALNNFAEGDEVPLELLQKNFEIFTREFSWAGNTSAEEDKKTVLEMLCK